MLLICLSIFQEYVRLPRSFVRDNIHDVAPSVMLCDPVGNMFEVVVQKKKNEAVFAEGWSSIGKFYGLHLGGWVKLVYVRSDRFLIQVRDKLDQQVCYPLPPTVSWIGESPKSIECVNEDGFVSHFANICQKPDFFHILEKTLTPNDVVSGLLVI